MVGPEFSIGVGEHGHWGLVSVAGELDMSTSPKLSSAVEQAAAARPRVLVDLSGVTFVDSSAVGVLISARNSLAESGGDLQLIVTPGPVRRVLDITGLQNTFSIHESLSGVPNES